MEYWSGVATLVGIYMTAVLSVSIPCGFTGMLSMGHVGSMTAGAYTSALLTKNFDTPVFLGAIAGMVTASVIGAIISYPTLKLHDDYFIIVTLGIGEAIKLIIQNAASIIGEARGLADIPKGSNSVNVWIIVVITVIALESLINPRHGRNCVAIREKELAAQSVGINVFQYKTEAMVTSCVLCGCVGALLEHYMHYSQPNMFTMVRLDELVIMVILGGRGSLTGTILAGLLMFPLPELLRFSLAEQWRMVLYGFLVVIVILFCPVGIVGIRELAMNDLKSLVGWVKGKFSKNNLKISRKE